MFGNGRVLAIAAHAHVRGDPLALEEDLDGPRRQPNVDLGAGEAIGNAVIMGGGVDVIIDADAACPPFGELIGLGRQRLQRRAIDLFEQLPARYAEPPDRTLFVEMLQQIADRRVDLGQTVKSSVAQPPEKPSLDDEHRLLDLRLVPRSSRPGRQDGGVVMRRHLGVGAIDLGIVETGLDDGRLGIVRHEKMRNAADRLQGPHMGVDPVGQRLCPARMRKSEARRAEHRDEDLRFPDFAGQPVDDDRHAVARVIDEQPLAGHVRLPHRHRQTPFPFPVEIAKSRVAIAAGIGDDIFLPEDRQGDVLALHLAMHGGPIGLSVTPMAGLDAALAKSRCSSTASVKSASSGQAMPAASHRRSVNRTVDDATPTRRAISRVDIPAFFNLKQSRTWRIDILSIGIGALLGKAERADPKRPEEAFPERFQIGIVGEIISEWWAISFRNRGRFEIGTVGDFARNQQIPRAETPSEARNIG